MSGHPHAHGHNGLEGHCGHCASGDAGGARQTLHEWEAENSLAGAAARNDLARVRRCVNPT